MTTLKTIPLSDKAVIPWDGKALAHAIRLWLVKNSHSINVMPMLADIKSKKLVFQCAARDVDMRNDAGRSNCFFDRKDRLVIQLHTNENMDVMGGDAYALYRAMKKTPHAVFVPA